MNIYRLVNLISGKLFPSVAINVHVYKVSPLGRSLLVLSNLCCIRTANLSENYNYIFVYDRI